MSPDPTWYCALSSLRQQGLQHWFKFCVGLLSSDTIYFSIQRAPKKQLFVCDLSRGGLKSHTSRHDPGHSKNAGGNSPWVLNPVVKFQSPPKSLLRMATGAPSVTEFSYHRSPPTVYFAAIVPSLVLFSYSLNVAWSWKIEGLTGYPGTWGSTQQRWTALTFWFSTRAVPFANKYEQA